MFALDGPSPPSPLLLLLLDPHGLARLFNHRCPDLEQVFIDPRVSLERVIARAQHRHVRDAQLVAEIDLLQAEGERDRVARRDEEGEALDVDCCVVVRLRA